MNYSWINLEDRVLWSKPTPSLGLGSTGTLIQGLYETYPDQARKYVRHRIWTTEAPDRLTRAMVRVAAKRLTYIDHASPPEAGFEITIPAPPPPPQLSASLGPLIQNNYAPWQHTLAALLQSAHHQIQSQAGLPRYLRNRAIAVVLCDHEDRILSYQTNAASQNPTRHAELSLVQSWISAGNKTLPVGYKIYTSLKPCKMCAAAIVQFTPPPSTPPSPHVCQVLHLEDDPGPMARHTDLDLSAEIESKQLPACSISVASL